MTTIDRRATATTTTKPTPPTTTGSPPGSTDHDVEDFASVAPQRGAPVVELDGGTGFHIEAQKACGPPPPPRAPRSTFATAEQAAAALQARFGVSLKGAFALEQLSRIHETFMQLGPKERDAVRGLELRREATSPDGTAGMAGLFRRGDDVDDGGRRIAGASITFYDAAFPSSGDGVIDRQTTMGVVLHEVGHALEGHALGGLVAEQRGGARVASGIEVFEERLGPDHAAALAAVRAFDDDVAAGPLIAAIKAWSRAHAVIGDDATPRPDRQAALVELQRQQDRATALVASLPAGHPARQPADVLVQLNAAVTSVQPVYLDAVARRRDAEAAMLTGGALPDVPDTAQDETLGALELEFSTMNVTTTDYGATAPVENFAEGYMLYKRDPAKLSPAALAFFKKHFPP